MEWILASASPRRKELLAELIPEFDVLPAKGEERAPKGLSPEALVQVLARQKATEVAALPQAQGKAVLGSDTVVALDGKILGKPANTAEATEMLAALSGRAHEVYTGVCIVCPDKREIVAADCTKVYFNRLTDAEIAAYVATGSPMDKAGAYGIQDGGLVERIEGSFSNVVGLPNELLAKLLQSIEGV